MFPASDQIQFQILSTILKTKVCLPQKLHIISARVYSEICKFTCTRCCIGWSVTVEEPRVCDNVLLVAVSLSFLGVSKSKQLPVGDIQYNSPV